MKTKCLSRSSDGDTISQRPFRLARTRILIVPFHTWKVYVNEAFFSVAIFGLTRSDGDNVGSSLAVGGVTGSQPCSAKRSGRPVKRARPGSRDQFEHQVGDGGG